MAVMTVDGPLDENENCRHQWMFVGACLMILLLIAYTGEGD